MRITHAKILLGKTHNTNKILLSGFNIHRRLCKQFNFHTQKIICIQYTSFSMLTEYLGIKFIT